MPGQESSRCWLGVGYGRAEEMSDPDEIVVAERLGLHPFAAGDRSRFVSIRPEFISGRRIV